MPPEGRALLEQVSRASAPVPVLLDGEIVAFDDAGRPSFEVLQQRMHVADAGRQAQFATEAPVALMVFDVLWRDGELLVDGGTFNNYPVDLMRAAGAARWRL